MSNIRFLICQYGHIKKRIKIKFDDLMTIDAVLNSIKENFGVEDPIFIVDDCPVDYEDLVDFINQYITNSSFVLNFTNNPNAEISNVEEISIESPVENEIDAALVSYNNAYLVAQETGTIFTYSSECATKESLINFLDTNCKLIIQLYKNNKILRNSERIILSKTIIKHIVDTKVSKSIARDELITLAQNISEIFPNEIPETYYSPHQGKERAKGKLLDAYNNYKHQLVVAGIVKSRSSTPARSTSLASTDTEPISPAFDLDSIFTAEENETILQELKSGVPENEINYKWNCTLQPRQEILNSSISTADFIKTFPVLSTADGYKLLINDAEKLYKTKLIFNISQHYLWNLIKKGRECRNLRLKHFLKLYDEEQDIEKKKVLSLFILPYICPNTTIGSKKLKLIRRASKIEIQESFMVHYMTIAEADSRERIFIQENKSTTIQPKIVLIGAPVEAAYVLVADIKYMFENITLAIEACMAIYLALNIKYPDISNKVWFFLQKFIFSITTPYDKRDSALYTLHNDLNLNSK